MGLLLFRKEFHAAIRAGTKRTTLRRWAGPRLRIGQIVWAGGAGRLRIESIQIVNLRELTAADARLDGFGSLPAMRQALRRFYPNRRDGRRWYRIGFAPVDVPAGD